MSRSIGLLDNALHALRKRHIIVSKEGERGVYRLQNRGFAFWIKLYATRLQDLIEGDSEEEKPTNGKAGVE
jgi:phage terminase Nu1 subunit (DNA packaging protein)